MNLRQRLNALALAMMLTLLAACGSPGIPRPPSLDLPQPVADLRVVRKGDRAYLMWTIPRETTDGITIHRTGVTRICRSVDVAMADCGNAVGEAAAANPAANSGTSKSGAKSTGAVDVQGNYVDQIPAAILSGNPEEKLFYGIVAGNQRGRDAGISNQVAISGFAPAPPPADFQATVTAEGVVLSWSGSAQPAESPGVERIYRVYRRAQGTNADAIAGEMGFTGGGQLRMVDQTFQWEKKYEYRATVVTRIRLADKSESQFEGDDTPAVKVFAHDVFPPAIPSGLQAVFSGAGQQAFVDLIWAPDTEADLAGYNIYRREADGTPVKINAEAVKTPAFRDSKVTPGHTYFYAVSSLDLRGNESERSPEANETVP